MISIDRLARSTFDLFAIVKRIVDARGQFRSLAEPWADTATSTGRLMIAVLGGLADVERDLIRTRTAEAVAWCACAMIPCLHRAVGCTSVFGAIIGIVWVCLPRALDMAVHSFAERWVGRLPIRWGRRF